MNFKLLSCSKHINSLLNENHTFSIHSVFKNTVNLHYQGSLITLQHQNVLLSPMSLSLGIDEHQFRNLFNNEKASVSIVDHKLLINDFVFSDESINWIDYHLHSSNKVNSVEIDRLIHQIDHCLLKHNKSQFILAYQAFLNNTQPPTHQLGKELYDLLLQLNDSSMDEWYQPCSKLLGLGEGLTPSGDDFLCGLFASLTYRFGKNDSFVNSLIEYLRNHTHKTTIISQAYLNHAMEGRYIKTIHALYHCISSMEALEHILDEFNHIGHSSGLDTLIGINFGLRQGGKRK
jgi:hypothetical protein